MRRNPNGLFPYLFASSWEYLLEFHKAIGHIEVLLLVLHGVTATLMFYLNMHNSWEKTWAIFKNWKMMSGLISLGCFVLLWVTAFTPLRKKYKYEIFHIGHVIFTVGGFFLMFQHITYPDLARNIMIVPAALWGLDLLWRFYTSFIAGHCRIVSKQVLPNTKGTVIELDASLPSLFSFEPGQWGYICIPAVNWVEFHPFALLASDITEPEVRFEHEQDSDLKKSSVEDEAPEGTYRRRKCVKVFVKTLGDWTRNLEKKPWSRLRKSVAFIQGPIGRIPTDFNHYPYIVLVGAGAGVAPVIGHAQRLYLENRRREEKNPMAKLTGGPRMVWVILVCTFRDILVPFNDDLLTLSNESSLFTIGCYETRRLAKSRIVSEEERAMISVNVMIGRPDLKDLFLRIKDEANKNKVAVVAAGPEPFEKTVVSASQHAGFTLHVEAGSW